ncbi:hypothetical protein Poly51_40200 [Rubripirellula tenax]|uniref:Uncharacterized protein n=1 Tax=Rubripirellula tenax TaxID=2528015 RepID=A0A5C6ERN2_9BACT|nr:hypothetical protein [Rubripirellula tenax]TWU50727.1 hypothetical protein Poly51_40200 [Rubripirellula tenax]
MSDDGNYDAKTSGFIHAIYVSKRGIELVVDKSEKSSANSDSRLTCRLDRSVSHSDNMLQLAQTALLNNLAVSLLGYGDDRDDTLEFDEIRISRDVDLV